MTCAPHITSDGNTSMMLRYLKLFTSTHPVQFKIQSIVFKIGLLNASKCKELVISFTKPEKEFPRLKIISGQIETVNHARILGLTISKDLKWNQHITNIVKKANKRIYFIIQLKRAHVPEADIIKFYTTCVRPVMEFSCQVFHFALPSYLPNALERVQKRVLSIIYPLTGYADCSQKSGIKPLSDRRVDACEKLFNEITITPAANMHNHIPSRYFPNYDLRHSRSFVVLRPKRTDLEAVFSLHLQGISIILTDNRF